MFYALKMRCILFRAYYVFSALVPYVGQQGCGPVLVRLLLFLYLKSQESISNIIGRSLFPGERQTRGIANYLVKDSPSHCDSFIRSPPFAKLWWPSPILGKKISGKSTLPFEILPDFQCRISFNTGSDFVFVQLIEPQLSRKTRSKKLLCLFFSFILSKS
jgi:hypothetical protein